MSATIAYYGNIVLNELILNIDSQKTDSYIGLGNSWKNIARNYPLTASLLNGISYNGETRGLRFDGGNDYATFSDFGTLSNFTVETWFKPKAFPNGGSYPAIITNPYDGVSINFAIGWSWINVNTIFVGYYNGGYGGSWRKISNISAPIDETICVAMTYTDFTLKAYRNGIFFNSLNTNTTTRSSSLGYYIGKRWDADNYFNGEIYSIKIYNRELTNTEILQNYNATKGRFGIT